MHKESRNNINSLNKNEKDYNSDNNQTSTQCLNITSKNTIQKLNDKPPIFLNKKGGKKEKR